MAEEVPSIGRSLSKIDGFVTFIQMLKSKADVMTVEEILQEVIVPQVMWQSWKLRIQKNREQELRILMS